MESYDVIIVGGGIAGTGLAYHLSKICPEKRVCLFDFQKIGGESFSGFRVTKKEIVDEYNFKYIKKFNGIKIGSNGVIYTTINYNFYAIKYDQICYKLFTHSNAAFRQEKALTIQNNILTTNKANYNFKYLIDCSGNSFFLKRLYNLMLPFRYWTGMYSLLNNNPRKLDKNYFYYLFDDYGHLEELYPFESHILYGDIYYKKKRDSYTQYNGRRLLTGIVPRPKIIKQYAITIPSTPVFPLVFKNFAFLGDSFGNARTSSGVGIEPILQSAKLLANSIKVMKIKKYESDWKNNYLKSYIMYLVSRLDRYDTSEVLRKFRKYPENSDIFKILNKYPSIFMKMWDNNPNNEQPTEIKRLYPKYQIIFKLYYYMYLKLKYISMNICFTY